MKKNINIIIVILLLAIVGFFAFNNYIYNEKQGDGLPNDFQEITFFMSGEPVNLIDGVGVVPSEFGEGPFTTVRYFGNEVSHDIDGDGTVDVAFLVTQETGGSGTFFYLVGALKRDDGYIGTHAVFVGDRIAPQTTEKGEGRQIVVNYADRAPGEPFTTAPSVGKSLYLLLDPVTLEFGEVVQNFEGESNGGTGGGAGNDDGASGGDNATLTPAPTPIAGQKITVVGKITCLPKISSGPQTLECAIGLKANSGEHYGLKNLFAHDPTYMYAQVDAVVEVTGTFTKEEMRGPDGNLYNIIGTITVDSINDK
ncbi:MAG TPA: hypothetical protein PKA60_00550 [Candidatus Paceibacterota bacterium]|nr:hypothetical protein [Candidatus Paceibacterota bacterium]